MKLDILRVLKFLIPLLLPRAGYWMAKCLVGGGVAILVSPWWLPILEAMLSKAFNWRIESQSAPVGLLLIALGLGVFIWERRMQFRREELPEEIVLAHFASFVDEPQTEHCFIKISNASTRHPVTITHVDYNGTAVVPVLATQLPRRLEPLAQFETHIPLAGIPDAKSRALLSAFRVTDSLGRRFESTANSSVSPIGYVAS